jgi:hypothetical protein
LVLDEILQERAVSSRGRRRPRAVKRKISKYPVRRRHPSQAASREIAQAVFIVK